MTADLICHGVPSPEVFRGWLAELEHSRGVRVVRYEHRPKSMGWGHFERVTWADGRVEQNTRLSETWKRVFYDNRMLRPSCYRCPYTAIVNRPGDLTIADFWGVEETPHARGDDKLLGVSLVLANKRLGLEELSRLSADFEVATINEALPRNPMLERPSSFKGSRDDPWRELYAEGVLVMVKSQHYLRSPVHYFGSRIKQELRWLRGR